MNLNNLPERDKFDPTLYKASHVTEAALSDPRSMKYEESNDLILAYQSFNESESALLTAGAALVHYVQNYSDIPFSDEDISKGVCVSGEIMVVAHMMGYDISTENGRNAAYKTMKAASKSIRAATITQANDKERSFKVYGPVDSVLYNPNHDGKIYFRFSPELSTALINNSKQFSVLNLILRNKAKNIGSHYAARLYEILNTYVWIMKQKNVERHDVYFDYVDLRCQLDLINSKNQQVANILASKEYADYKINDEVAYKRAMAIEELDEIIKKAIAEYKESDEYKNRDNVDKDEKKRIKDKLKHLNSNIICKYNDPRDFKKRVLEPTKDVFLSCYRQYGNLMEICFDYSIYKHRGKMIGVNFSIYTIKGYIAKMEESGHQISLSDISPSDFESLQLEDYKIEENRTRKETSIPEIKEKVHKVPKKEKWEDTADLFESYIKSIDMPSELSFSFKNIMDLAKRYDSDLLISKIPVLVDYHKNTSHVNNPTAFLTDAIKGDWSLPDRNAEPKNGKLSNSFNNFEAKQVYNMDEIEKMVLGQKYDSSKLFDK